MFGSSGGLRPPDEERGVLVLRDRDEARVARDRRSAALCAGRERRARARARRRRRAPRASRRRPPGRLRERVDRVADLDPAPAHATCSASTSSARIGVPPAAGSRGRAAGTWRPSRRARAPGRTATTPAGDEREPVARRSPPRTCRARAPPRRGGEQQPDAAPRGVHRHRREGEERHKLPPPRPRTHREHKQARAQRPRARCRTAG